MRHILPAAVALVLLTTASASATDQLRCGWYQNPTPGNVWLDDADGTWVLSTQGRDPAPGLWDAYGPQLGEDEWVLTNGSYGYTCACVQADYGPVGSAAVNFVNSISSLPLSRCLADPALPVPGR